VSALGHYLEEDGIATVAIALIRPQAENTKPPRALWVPFELGRPLGPPSDTAFQRRVLLAALTMLVESGGPVRIIDFPDDDPRARPDPARQPPFRPAEIANVSSETLASRLEAEVSLLQGAHERWMAQHGRSTVGLSGLPMTEAARYVADWLRGKAPPSPREGFSAPLILRFAVDDLKAYCLEAAAAGTAKPSSRQLSDWLWNETAVGAALYALRELLLTQEDERLRLMSPISWCQRRGYVLDEGRMKDVKVLAFDTGGTVLDWHSGLTAAMAAWGTAHGIDRDWHALANEHRRRSLRRMTNTIDPAFNIDDVHHDVLSELFDENELDGSVAGWQAIAQRWHRLDAWPDFAPALRRLRRDRICASFTILSLSLIVDVSRHNGLDWDAVIPCEMLRIYKPLPDAYRRAAKFLAVEPRDILMVACHNFDLDAARGEGFRTAFVRRPDEWGPAGPPDPVPNPACDLVVDGFAELAEQLGA
jgi:2-haloacid dehalogenase